MIVEVSGVSHRYQTQPVLNQVSFAVPQGRVVGLVGPNAAGKSTLMRALVGQLVPTEGDIKILGRDVRREARSLREVVGFLPERADVYPELCVWEYLDLFAAIAGHHGKMRRERIDAALESAGMIGRAEAATRELSKGLRQRLALAAVLMHDPAVVVLDEPTDGLDPESRQALLNEIRKLAILGRTVFLSSHVLAEVEQVAQTTLILVNGQLRASEASESATQHVYTMRLRGDLNAALALLQAHPDVSECHAADGALLLTLKEGVADAAGPASAVVAAGLALVELSEQKDSLRRRFARAVGRTAEELS